MPMSVGWQWAPNTQIPYQCCTNCSHIFVTVTELNPLYLDCLLSTLILSIRKQQEAEGPGVRQVKAVLVVCLLLADDC